MKLSFVLCLAATLNVFASGYSQTARVSLSMHDVRIEDVLNKIEEQTEFYFLYNQKLVDLSKKVSIDVSNKPINEVLNTILDKGKVDYVVYDRQIIVAPTGTVNLAGVQQGIAVTGTVTDASGEPMPGVSVVIKGTVIGQVTDIDGRYAITVPDKDAVLVFSFIGYTTQEATVGNRGSISVIMRENTKEIDEVVVVGYGQQKKATLTGAVAAIGNNDIVTTKNVNIQNAINGKIAGVKVAQKTSEPGEFTNNFSIRGMGTPLIVIDGVPRSNFVRLDANEIESISILKDASASIYGVRAANGVVLVTTKKGSKNEKFKMEYNGYYGIQRVIQPARHMDAAQWMLLQNERALNNFESSIPYSKELIQSYQNGTLQSTDWTAETLRESAPLNNHSLSASGGTEKFDYFVNFGYDYEGGIFKSGDMNYNRYNLRSNVSAYLAKGWTVRVGLNLMKDCRNALSTNTDNLFTNYYTQYPAQPYYYVDDAGNILYSDAANGRHPHFGTETDLSGYNKVEQRLAQTNVALEWKIPGITGLKATGMFSYDYQENSRKQFEKEFTMYNYNASTNVYSPVKKQSPSVLQRWYAGYENILLQLSLMYEKQINAHGLNIFAAYEESTRKADNLHARREFSMDALDQLFAGNTTNQSGDMLTGTDDLYAYAYRAIIGRINYDYASKYLAEVSFRYDGSSKNAPAKRWGFFPAVSAGWRIAEEAFIKDSESLRFISNLKLRASYGLLGDDTATNNYQFVNGYTYPSGGYLFDNKYVNGLQTRGIANDYITWYESAIVNMGLDVDLWNGLLGATFEIFQRDRSGLLATRVGSLPGVVGANFPQENLESDQTRGLELTLSHHRALSNDFKYGLSGNISFSRTMWKYREVAQYGNSYLNWRNNTTNRWNGMAFGYDYLGPIQSMDAVRNLDVIYNYAIGNSYIFPGDPLYGDWNGDGIIDSNDEHPISINNENEPLINYGFTVNAQYKNFDLSLLFQGTAMSWMRRGLFYEHQLMWGRGGLDIFMDRWHRADEFDPNSDWVAGYYPSTYDNVTARERFVNTPNTTFWLTNSSFMRLKSLDLGYTLPSSLARKFGVDRARFFFNAYNLFTLTKVNGVDPEHPSNGQGTIYPITRTFNFGTNITF